MEIDYNTRKDDVVGLASQLGLLFTHGRISVPRPGGRRFKSDPRHQDKAEGSDNAPLRFLTYNLLASGLEQDVHPANDIFSPPP